MSSKPKCFVIRPMEERSDMVCDLYVDPACQAEYEVIRGGHVSAGPITDALFQDLNNDSLVIAYLGSPKRIEGEGNRWFWNPNVMLESGYRLGSNRPIVFIREHRQSEDEPMLPFDLANLQVVELPSEQEERQKAHRDQTVERIRNFAVVHLTAARKTAISARFPIPAVTMIFEAGEGKVKSASEDAAEFFGFPHDKDLTGTKVVDLVDKLFSRMIPRQKCPFKCEQDQLIGQLFTGAKPRASVCLVFGDEDIEPRSKIPNAFLPIVARFLVVPNGPTELDVIYLDVTDTARCDEDGVVRWGRR